MSRIKVTYVAVNSEYNRPIMTAESMEDLKLGLDEYHGKAICKGFVPHYTKYPDEYEGSYTYICTNNGVEEVDIIRVYCTEFYPMTKIESDEINQKKEQS